MGAESGTRIKGIGAAPGLAVARVVVVDEQDLSPAGHRVAPEGREDELARLAAARSRVKEELARMRDDTARRAGEEEAAIFDAHMLMVDDPELADAARASIMEDGWNAEKAFHDAAEQFAAVLESMDDEYLRERAVDVRDVARQVIAQLKGLDPGGRGAGEAAGAGGAGEARRAGEAEAGGAGEARRAGEAGGAAGGAGGAGEGVPAVIVARELTPSDTARWRPGTVAAMVTESGGATSHVAILARSMGLPAVVGADGCLAAARNARWAAVDGDKGLVIFDPDAASRRRWGEAVEEERRREEELRRVLRLPSVTGDGTAVELAVNIGSPGDARRALEFMPDGVGLFRTEFLFLERSSPPAEDEQEKVYREVLDVMGGRPVLFRTLDVGADKRLPFIDWDDEENPALGLRGLRLGLARPDLLNTQFRAILRAGAAAQAPENPDTPGTRIRIMVPMVIGREEVEEARRLMDGAAEDLRGEGVEVPPVEFGIMVETPAAALMARELARAVDFFSIGTNDLTQYTLAADRVNEAVADLFDPYHPAVLRLVHIVGQAARGAGIWCGVCGESGGDPLLTPFFIGAGIRELSMAPARLARVKRVIRSLSIGAAEDLAAAVIEAPDARRVKELLGGFTGKAAGEAVGKAAGKEPRPKV